MRDLETRYKNTCDIVNQHSKHIKIMLDRIRDLEYTVTRLLKIIEKKEPKTDFDDLLKMFGGKK